MRGLVGAPAALTRQVAVTASMRRLPAVEVLLVAAFTGMVMSLQLVNVFGQFGLKTVAGGATGLVGDPSGKDESRQLLSQEQIQANIAGIRKVFERFLAFGDGPTDAVMVNNADWLMSFEQVQRAGAVGIGGLRWRRAGYGVRSVTAKPAILRRRYAETQGSCPGHRIPTAHAIRPTSWAGWTPT